MVPFIVASWCITFASFYAYATYTPWPLYIRWPATLFVPVVVTTAARIDTVYGEVTTLVCSLVVAFMTTFDAMVPVHAMRDVPLHLLMVAYIAISLSTFTWCLYQLVRERRVAVAHV